MNALFALANKHEFLSYDCPYPYLIDYLNFFSHFILCSHRNAFQSDENIRLQQHMATLTRDNHHLKRKLV